MLLQDPVVRPLIFLILMFTFACLERMWPRRKRHSDVTPRWLGNIGILVVSTLVARILLPLAPVGAALWAQQSGVGLAHAVHLPGLVEGVAVFIALDLLIYFQHRLFHAVPLLWRVHRMHHTDLDFDVTTGIRFHPIEIFLSLVIKVGAVIALGAHPLAVILFEIVLNGTSLFNHSNLALPKHVDCLLRLGVVTPDMHRVHHSVRETETNSNFGFNLPWWDRLFGTYRAQPTDGHTEMTIGLDVFRDRRAVGLVHLLIQPFVNDTEGSHSDGVRS